MAGEQRTTHETLARFGGVEADQRYTRLLGLFAEDAVYYDPFFGAQVGIDAIRAFMEHMEELVPASGARFDSWEVTAETDCGWAQWLMVAPNQSGVEVPVPGESLYRLRDGLVIGVADYLDPVAYSKLRGENGRTPDFVSAAGSLPPGTGPSGAAAAAISDHVCGLTAAGRWPGAAELIDHAGDESVGWAQWTFHGPHGDFAGWSVRRHNGRIVDFFDTVTAWRLSQPSDQS